MYSIKGLSSSDMLILHSLKKFTSQQDSYTYMHSLRTAFYATQFAQRISISTNNITTILKGALLHDIGKSKIDDAILFNPQPLTKEEKNIMQLHVDYGLEIVKDIKQLDGIKDIIYNHHEHWDGNGYPTGLRHEQISINTRIVTIVDVFDALTSSRPYKDPIPLNYSLLMMLSEKNKHFDPKLLELFIPQASELFKIVCDKYDDFIME